MKPIRLTYDNAGDIIMAGDYLRCYSRRTGEPTGTCYHIVSARPVLKRRAPPPDPNWPWRWAIAAFRVDPSDVPGNATVHSLVWHPRRS